MATRAIPARLAASPAETILSWMQGHTVTQGWDVVCAIAFDKINEWFLPQYVERLSNGEGAVINGTVPLPTVNNAVNISAEFVDLTLGPPLISFSQANPPGTVELTANFLSGLVNQTATTCGAVLSTHVVTPGDGYVLTGHVPLASVQGEVENSHDVVIDVRNGTSFTAELGVPCGMHALLGQFIQNWLVNHLDGYKYKLGTLLYDDNGTNLKPAGTFQFATQIDPANQTDTGRLLLFIPTTYNPGGGSQTALGLADVVPQGCSTALIISSRVLFGSILKSFYETTYSNFGVKAAASQEGVGAYYDLMLTDGSVTIPPCEYPFRTSGPAKVFTGRFGAGFAENDEPVVIPLKGMRVRPTSNQLLISGTLVWPQDLAIVAPVPRSEGIHNQGTAAMAATVSCPVTASVPKPADPNDKTPRDAIDFNPSPGVSVTFDATGIANGTFSSDWQALGSVIAAAAQENLVGLFKVPLPEVNAFAVSNLLFPGKNILDFQSAYVPGDLVVFGDAATPGVTVTPGAATLNQAQTQQFSATTGSGQAVRWSLQSGDPGTISATGLYTAPSQVTQVQHAHVIATSTGTGGTAEAAQALVTLMPGGVRISPSFTVSIDGSPAPLSATVNGVPHEAVTWSIDPQGGHLTPDGVYYPPPGMVSPQLVTVTATSVQDPSLKGTAQLAALTDPPTIGVTPNVVLALTPGQTQQFQVSFQGKAVPVNWSLLPSVGRITNGGVYIPPDTITASQTVLVLARFAEFPGLYGYALVTLSPGD